MFPQHTRRFSEFKDCLHRCYPSFSGESQGKHEKHSGNIGPTRCPAPASAQRGLTACSGAAATTGRPCPCRVPTEYLTPPLLTATQKCTTPSLSPSRAPPHLSPDGMAVCVSEARLHHVPRRTCWPARAPLAAGVGLGTGLPHTHLPPLQVPEGTTCKTGKHGCQHARDRPRPTESHAHVLTPAPVSVTLFGIGLCRLRGGHYGGPWFSMTDLDTRAAGRANRAGEAGAKHPKAKEQPGLRADARTGRGRRSLAGSLCRECGPAHTWT